MIFRDKTKTTYYLSNPKMHIFSGVLSTQNVNVARFARNNDETLSVNFKHLAIVRRENNCNLLASSVFFFSDDDAANQHT